MILTERGKPFALFVTSTLWLCSAIAQAPSHSRPPQQREMGSRKHYVGLPNFAEVSPNLLRGGQPGVDGLEALKGTVEMPVRGAFGVLFQVENDGELDRSREIA